MAHLRRHLNRSFTLLGLLLFASTGFAQAPSAATDEAATFQAFALSGNISGLFYDHKGRKIEFSASQWLFTSPYPAPASGTLSLYREEPPVPPETKPKRIPVADINLGPGGPWLLFLNANAAPGQPQVTGRAYDYSWQAHPADTIRVFNFSELPVAAQVGQQTLNLPPAAFEKVPYPADKGRLWFKAAAFLDGGWRLKISEPQRVRNNARTTWVLLKMPFVADEPEPDKLFVRKLTQPIPVSDGTAARVVLR